MTIKKKQNSEELADTIIEGIQKKKGLDIVRLNLKQLPNSVSNFFIICHGTSRPQVEAIAESVDRDVKQELGYDPWSVEGRENAEWILLDYVDVVVHIFQERTRKFFQLEELWADAEEKRYESNE